MSNALDAADRLWAEKPLTDEEASRPVEVNGVTMSFAHFLTYNDDGLSPRDMRDLRQLKPGQTAVIGGGAFAAFEVTRID